MNNFELSYVIYFDSKVSINSLRFLKPTAVAGAGCVCGSSAASARVDDVNVLPRQRRGFDWNLRADPVRQRRHTDAS